MLNAFLFLSMQYDMSPGSRVNELIFIRITHLKQHNTIDEHTRIYCIPDVIREYSQNGYGPIWTNDRQVASFIDILEHAGSEGISPSDYHLLRLKQLAVSRRDEYIATRDILLTDAFLLYASHISSGKVDPDQYTARWHVITQSINPAEYLHRLKKEKVSDIIKEISPHAAEYHRLGKALNDYMDILRHGGWGRIDGGKMIEPGDRDHRIVKIRERLKMSGNLFPSASTESDLYDDDLRRSVLSFQQRHGIPADGIIGRETIGMMNIPPDQIVQQIRINMERWRWLPHDPGSYYLFVNSANFELKVVRDGVTVSRNKVIVGRPYRKTPILSSQIEYLVFNPSWIIPHGILAKDILPLVRKDMGYLEKEHIRIIDSNGRFVDPRNIDWKDESIADEYLFRQDPGKNNALGSVKFVFPNSYSIYLHDTPAKDLFENRKRTFSSGCIRVERALNLAYLLLDDETYWSMDYIQLIVQSTNYQMVPLRVKPPIYVTYFTFWVEDDGTYQFRRDIYHRDPHVLSALQEEPPAVINQETRRQPKSENSSDRYRPDNRQRDRLHF